MPSLGNKGGRQLLWPSIVVHCSDFSFLASVSFLVSFLSRVSQSLLVSRFISSLRGISPRYHSVAYSQPLTLKSRWVQPSGMGDVREKQPENPSSIEQTGRG